MQKFKQGETTAAYRRIYMFLASSADGYTPVTSLAGATVNLFRNGTAFGTQPTTPASLTHISVGHWYYEIPITPINYLSDLGILTVTVQDANIRTVVLSAEVVNYDWTQPSGATAAQVWTYSDRQLTASLDPTASQIWANATRTLTASLDPTAAQIWSNATRTLTASLDPTAAVIADAVWDEAYADHTNPGSFGKLMDILRKSNYVTEGTVTSAIAATNTTFSTNLTNESGSLDHQSLLFVTGDHVGTSIPILDYQLGNGVVTLEEPLHQAPGTGDEFVVLPQHVHAVIGIADGILNRLLDSSDSSVDQFNERTVRSALRAMRNKVVVNNGSIVVYKENDIDSAWEGTVDNITNVTVNPDGGD